MHVQPTSHLPSASSSCECLHHRWFLSWRATQNARKNKWRLLTTVTLCGKAGNPQTESSATAACYCCTLSTPLPPTSPYKERPLGELKWAWHRKSRETWAGPCDHLDTWVGFSFLQLLAIVVQWFSILSRRLMPPHVMLVV